MTQRPTANQSRIIWFALTALAIAAIVIVIAGFVWGFGMFLNLLSPVLWPLAIAAVIAYLLDPAVNYLERKKMRRTWAILAVFVIVLCVVAGILAYAIPKLVDETNQLVSKIPTYTSAAQKKIEGWADKADKVAAMVESNTNAPVAATNATAATTNKTNFSTPKNRENESQKKTAQTNSVPANSSTNSVSTGQQIHEQIVSSTKSWITELMPKIGNWLFNLLGKATSLVDFVFALILIPIYTFYFLREKRGIKSHWHQYLPIRDSRVKDEIVFILSAVNQHMIAFFRGQVLVALISGTIYGIAFLALGLDYALLLGLLAIILIIIPFIGAIILILITCILTAVQFGDWLHPLIVVCIFTVVQSLESFFYAPRIMGNRVNLHPLVVIIALMAGITLLGGLLGGILAIPMAAVLRVLLFRYVWKKNETAS